MTTARRIASLAAATGALLITGSAVVGAFNPQPEPPGLALGAYNGYSQSETHAESHPFMALSIDSVDDKGRLAGVLTMGAPGGDLQTRFPFEGKLLDDAGHFKGRGFEPDVGEVKFEGVLQAVGFEGDDGALAVAHYRFTDAAGRVDQGMTWLLRSFKPCADCRPPELIGAWGGRAISGLTGRDVTLALRISDQDGASFMGVAELVGVGAGSFTPAPGAVTTLGIDPTPFRWDFVATIGARGNIVLIGVGDSGFVEVEATFVDSEPAMIRGTYVDRFATDAHDLGLFSVGLGE